MAEDQVRICTGLRSSNNPQSHEVLKAQRQIESLWILAPKIFKNTSGISTLRLACLKFALQRLMHFYMWLTRDFIYKCHKQQKIKAVQALEKNIHCRV